MVGDKTLFKCTKLTIQCYIQRLLFESVREMSISFDSRNASEVQVEVASVLCYAICLADLGKRLKQYGDDGEAKKEFKNTARSALCTLYYHLRLFNHLKWLEGDPDNDIPGMSHEQHVQCLNLFFRRGLYWSPPHPALLDFSFPEMTIEKNNGCREREQKAAVEKRKGGELTLKKPKKRGGALKKEDKEPIDKEKDNFETGLGKASV